MWVVSLMFETYDVDVGLIICVYLWHTCISFVLTTVMLSVLSYVGTSVWVGVPKPLIALVLES